MNLPEKLSMNEQHYISGVMAIKKAPYDPKIKLNPVNYDMKAEHVTLIREMGLYQYLQKGYSLPPSDFIEDYKNGIKRGHKYMDHVKKSENMGTGSGTI